MSRYLPNLTCLSRSSILRCARYLGLGGVTTIAVSWSIAFFGIGVTPKAEYMIDLGQMAWMVDVEDRISEIEIRSDAATGTRLQYLRSILANAGNDEFDGGELEALLDHDRIPHWSRVHNPQPSNNEVPGNAIEYASGFPWPALRCLIVDPSIAENGQGVFFDSNGIMGGVRWRSTGTGAFDSVTSLPIWPIWPAFLADTILYAFCWLGILKLLPFSRGLLRMRQGKCPVCNYELHHDFDTGCSECSWNRHTLVWRS